MAKGGDTKKKAEKAGPADDGGKGGKKVVSTMSLQAVTVIGV